METTLYSITQEAFANIVKHAHATRVSVVLAQTSRSVAAIVDDNGRVLDQDSTHAGVLGLVGMRERVEVVEGRLRIESAEGAGTTIAAEDPLS